MKKSLSKNERLKKRSDIDRVFSSGRKVSCSGARLLYIANGLPVNRIVIAPVRKIGGSVRRNRVKRLGKEAYRNIKHGVRLGYDLAFVMFPGEFGYEERKAQVASLLRRAGLFEKNGE